MNAALPERCALTRWPKTVIGLALGAWMSMMPALAASPLLVRLSEQNGESRIAVRLPTIDGFSLTQERGHIVLHVIGAMLPKVPRGQARGVDKVAISGSFLRFDVGAGRRVRVVHDGNDLILAVVPEDPSAAAATPTSGDAGVLPGLPVPLVAVIEGERGKQDRSLALKSNPAVAPAAAPVDGPPPPAATAPAGNLGTMLASMVEAPDGPPGRRGLLLPFARDVGAAAFGRGPDTLIVFDLARPVDLTDVRREPLAQDASIQLLPEATLLTLSKRQAKQIMLRRVDAGWMVLPTDSGSGSTTIVPVIDNTDLRLPVAAPGRTVIVPDPSTGENLLVGTLRSGAEVFPAGRRAAAYVIVPTSLGIVVQPLSDRIEMRPTRDAFLLSGLDPQALLLPPDGEDAQGRADSDGLHILGFRRGALATLYRRAKEATSAAAATPAGSRFKERMRAAQDLLALGDGMEAATLAQVGVADDARQACVRLTRIVRLAAAVLLGQASDDACPDDPAYAASPEVALWRGLSLARQDPMNPEAARLLAANLPLLESYPQPLVSILLPIAAESLVQAGTAPQAALVDALPADRSLAFARALLLERRGDRQAAQAAFETLKSDADLRIADLSEEQVIAIRLRKGELKPQDAADLLDQHLLDARITGHELPARYHLVDLRMQAGQWRDALALLRETSLIFPQEREAIRVRAGDVLKRLAESPAGGSGAEILRTAAVIQANSDLVPLGPDGDRLSRFLVDRLMALDLPGQAAPLVAKMLAASQSATEKATLGATLAGLDLQQNDPEAAQQVLQETSRPDLPPDVQQQRQLLLARALAAEGHAEAAVTAIKEVDSSPALDLRASLLASLGRWADASDVLSVLAARAVPAAGALDHAQRDVLLRLASAASRAGDLKRERQVRLAVQGRVADADQAALFQLLTSGGEGRASPASAVNLPALRRMVTGVKALSQ